MKLPNKDFWISLTMAIVALGFVYFKFLFMMEDHYSNRIEEVRRNSYEH